MADPSPVGVLGSAAPDADGVLDERSDDGDDADDLELDDAERDDVEPEELDDVFVAIDLLGLSNLHVHRLGLRSPLGTAADADLVAALSELVGFDPDPGVVCLAPTAMSGDPARSAVDRAARRIARSRPAAHALQVLELSVVEAPEKSSRCTKGGSVGTGPCACVMVAARPEPHASRPTLSSPPTGRGARG